MFIIITEYTNSRNNNNIEHLSGTMKFVKQILSFVPLEKLLCSPIYFYKK